jgi:hypothetical protein
MRMADPHRVIRDAVVESQEVLVAHAHRGSERDCEGTISALFRILDNQELLQAMEETADDAEG